MTHIHAFQYLDTSGVAHGFINDNGQPQICAQTYLQAIAEGDITGHTPWTKIGYCPSFSVGVNTDIWSYAATQPVYLYPTAAMGMEVLSSNNVDDIGTVIKTGTSTGGSSTTLIDAGANFTGATAVEVGDAVILDKSGTTPEFGWVTAVDSATQLTIAGGFSLGGTGSGRAYSIIDTSATAGAHAVQLGYLSGAYAEKNEIVILNGTTVVATVNTDIFRVNSYRVIAAGANAVPTGGLSIRHLSDTPVYSYISPGMTRARNSVYTVPLGKTLYVTDFNGGYATTGNANKEYARITTRCNVDPTTRFYTGKIFYPFTDSIGQNVTIPIKIDLPTKLPAKTDIKISAIATASGIVITTLRGWLE